ncbi:hypothetical protein [Aureivirga sp. CE67]|uniref:hypothetical protein n=1 Tax=Aureivirga sp. CE67 TaxID=1788983 RepID=UPI0018CB0E78|nr:hypothetical protein [Aureivirga sp. CE67]
MKKILLLFLLIFTYSCATKDIKYDRNKILTKYTPKYTVLVDMEKTNLETLFLDKNNIEKVEIDKKNRELRITQRKQVEFYELKNLKLDSLSLNNDISLVVIDGVPIKKNLIEKVKIDTNAIKNVTILTKEVLNNSILCKRHDGDILIITTKY